MYVEAYFSRKFQCLKELGRQYRQCHPSVRARDMPLPLVTVLSTTGATKIHATSTSVPLTCFMTPRWACVTGRILFAVLPSRLKVLFSNTWIIKWIYLLLILMIACNYSDHKGKLQVILWTCKTILYFTLDYLKHKKNHPRSQQFCLLLSRVINGSGVQDNTRSKKHAAEWVATLLPSNFSS